VCFFGLVAVGLLAARILSSRPWSFPGEELLAYIVLAIIGTASIIGFMGLCGLFCGVKLERYFTYPFTIYFGACVGLTAARFLGPRPRESEQESVLLWEMVTTGVVGGIIGGWLLSRRIDEYGRWARAGAAVGAIPMMVFGGYFMLVTLEMSHYISIEPEPLISFVTGLAIFALFGGAPGAVFGALIDGLCERRAARDTCNMQNSERTGGV